MRARLLSLMTIALAAFACSQALAGGAKLPSFSLKDPQGGVHQSGAFGGRPLIVVYTAPTLGNEGAQKHWSDYLAQTMPKKAAFVMIEDMSVGVSRELAEDDMKKDWHPGDVPLLLLDDDGGLRDAFGCPRGATRVYVYDGRRQLVHTEEGTPSLDLAKSLWGMAK